MSRKIKLNALRIYKSGKQVLDKWNGGTKIIEHYYDRKQRLTKRIFKPVEIIYVYMETGNE